MVSVTERNNVRVSGPIGALRPRLRVRSGDVAPFPPAFLADNRADLAKVTVPTLIVQCAHDVIAPLAVGAFVHDRIPDSELLVLG